MSAATSEIKHARLDTGAKAILLRQSTASAQGWRSEKTNNTEIVFGNGHATVTDTRTKIGDLDALICQDETLKEDLLSVNPLLDIGCKLTMDKDRGLLSNETTGVKIHVQRQGKRWAVDLEDLSRTMQTDPKLEEGHVEEMIKANAVVNRDAKFSCMREWATRT